MYAFFSRLNRAVSVGLALVFFAGLLIDQVGEALGFTRTVNLAAYGGLMATTILLDRLLARLAFHEALKSVADAPDPG